jgi:hypothetical protein
MPLLKAHCRSAARAPTFGAATRAHQTFAIARESFRVIVTGWGTPALVALAVLVNLIAPLVFQDDGSPQLPTTGEFVNVLEQTSEHGMWLIVPLLIIYYAGELVWRERDTRLGEITGVAPVPVWVSFAGKFVGLALALAAAQAVLMGAAMLAQARMGYYEFEVDFTSGYSSESGSPTISCSPCWHSSCMSWLIRNTSAI